MDAKQPLHPQENGTISSSSSSDKEISASGASSSGGTWSLITIVKTTVLCAVFMFVGPALILLNKYIMQSLSFPYPMFLSGLGVLTSYLFARLLIALDFAQIEKKSEVEGARFYTRVLPVGIAHAGTLATGNWVYLLLDVGFIQMLKSFTPVVVMAFLFLTNIEIPTRPVVVSILIISFGTAMTCSFTPNASVVGMAVMLLSEVCEAVRLVLTQFLLKDMKLGVIEGQYVLSPASAACLFLMSAFVEVPVMLQTGDYRALLQHPWEFAAVSLCGLVINFLSYFVIQLTSSLTLKVLVMIRNVLVIVVGIIVYGEETSTNEFVGYLFALLGFVLYNLAKMNVLVFGPAAPAVAVADRRPEASSGSGSGSDSCSGEGGKYGSGGGGDTEGGEEGSTAGSSSSGGSSSCCSRWLSIFQLQDLETQVHDRERAAAEMRRSAGIYPGFNLSSYAPSSGSAFSAGSLSGAGAGAGAGSSSGLSMVRLANLTAGKQRNLQSFSKDSDCEEAAADASETSRLLAGGGSGSGGGGSGGSSGSSSSSRSGVTGASGSSGDTNNRKKKG